MNTAKLVSLSLAGALCVSAGMIACVTSSEDALSDESGNWGAGANDGSGSSSSTSSGTATGTSTGTGTGQAPPPPDPLAPPPPDLLECEQLDKEKPLVLYLSSDDSNSMGSPALARELLSNGVASNANIRTYEFLNYYRIDYPAPAYGALGIHPQMALGDEEGTYDLQIGVRAFDPIKPRRPMTLTLVLDTSGSMGGVPIARERAVVKAIAKSLAAGDIVNMVFWDTSNNVIMAGHQVTGPNDAKVLKAAEALSASGGTNLNGGLVAGYELATKHYGANRLNRLVLISDGGANAGIIEADLIAKNSADADKEGIYLVGVGTGPAGGYHDTLMDTVTDAGRGAYVYIDDKAEAERMFVDRFDEVMEVAARSVQVELTLPWYFQMHVFNGEEYSENPAEVDPQHLAPGDAMVINQVLKPCSLSVVDKADTVSVVVSWQTPLTYLKKETSVSMSVGELLEGDQSQLIKGKAIVAYAEALKSHSSADLSKAMAAVTAAQPGGDPELSEIAKLIAKHPNYKP